LALHEGGQRLNGGVDGRVEHAAERRDCKMIIIKKKKKVKKGRKGKGGERGERVPEGVVQGAGVGEGVVGGIVGAVVGAPEQSAF
jgi:hypothetical protein